MTDVIFDDFYYHIESTLLEAEYEVKIAVAWLNFKMYQKIFLVLLSRRVGLKIIINDDFINAKHDGIITYLTKNGAIIFKRKMPSSKQYMHEKFCIVDDKWVLNGSYNWSYNANKNFENLMISTKKLLIDKFNHEFQLIMSMDIEYIKQLQGCCFYNIMVLEEEDDLTTIGTIYNIWNGELHAAEREPYESFVLQNLYEIYYQYDSLIEQAYDSPYELEAINVRIDFEMQKYLSRIRNTKTPVPIHGIGVIGREMQYPNFEDIYIKILWKERFCASGIEDRYELPM